MANLLVKITQKLTTFLLTMIIKYEAQMQMENTHIFYSDMS